MPRFLDFSERRELHLGNRGSQLCLNSNLKRETKSPPVPARRASVHSASGGRRAVVRRRPRAGRAGGRRGGAGSGRGGAGTGPRGSRGGGKPSRRAVRSRGRLSRWEGARKGHRRIAGGSGGRARGGGARGGESKGENLRKILITWWTAKYTLRTIEISYDHLSLLFLTRPGVRCRSRDASRCPDV